MLLTLDELKRRPAIRFPEGNKIAYWQDFCGWRGVPSNLTFYIVEDAPPQHEAYYLAARGYGARDYYGNGTIMVKKSDCPAATPPVGSQG